MVSVRRPAQGTVMFKADAKGEDHRVVLGGYEIIQGQLGRWFSLEVSQEEAPWLFKKGKSSSTISAGELLASLTCILLFVDEGKDERRMQGTVAVTGATDNQGNSYIVSKLMTTKFPVGAILMETVKQLARRNLWLNLHWIPREQNTEADALTNLDFSKFDANRRVEVTWSKLMSEMDDLHHYMKLGVDLYSQLESLKEIRKRKARPDEIGKKFRPKYMKTAW